MPSARASASPIREQSGSSRRRRPKLSPNRFGILKPQAFSTQRSARWTEITGLLRPSSTVSPRGSPKTIRDHPKPANEKLTQDVDRRRVCSVDVSNVLTEEKTNQVMALGRLGWSLRRVERETGVHRETAAGYLKAAGIAVRYPGGQPQTPSDSKPANEVIADSVSRAASPTPAPAHRSKTQPRAPVNPI